MPMRSKCLTALVMAAAATTAGAMGCSLAATETRTGTPAMNASDPIADLHFDTHNFSVYCFNTIGCTVIYNHRYQVEDKPDEVEGPPPGDDYRSRFGGGETAVHNFPDPAIVRWKSLDGVPHEAEIDIAKIFQGGRVLHRVHASEVPPQWFHQDLMPDVYLEVNDRTIHVFMKAYIPTKEFQIPGNRFTNFKEDLIEAWSHTY